MSANRGDVLDGECRRKLERVVWNSDDKVKGKAFRQANVSEADLSAGESTGVFRVRVSRHRWNHVRRPSAACVSVVPIHIYYVGVCERIFMLVPSSVEPCHLHVRAREVYDRRLFGQAAQRRQRRGVGGGEGGVGGEGGSGGDGDCRNCPSAVGVELGPELGATDGATDGVIDGATDGTTLGIIDGAADGIVDSEGVADGAADVEGTADGTADGAADGAADVEGTADGTADGAADGAADVEGTEDGATDGATETSDASVPWRRHTKENRKAHMIDGEQGDQRT